MTPDPGHEADRWLAALAVEADAVAASLAHACGGRADDVQIEAFDLAWAVAELRAATAGLTARHGLAHDLALLFAVEAGQSALARLEGIARAIDHAPDVLTALRGDPDWNRVQREAAGPRALKRIGAAVIAATDEIDEPPLDDVTRIARDTFARFAQHTVAPLAAGIHRDDLTVPEAILAPMRDLGAFGLSIPERYGGVAGDEATAATTMVAVTEVLSEASLAAAGSLITRPEILSRALLAGGTEAQKRHWLPRIARGAPLCAIAITEPDYGSDAAALQLRATKVEGGWTLDGAKTWCTFAGKAEVLMVVARTTPGSAAGHRGLSLMMVEKPSDDGHAFAHEQPGGGRLAGRAIPTIGYRGMHSFDLSFDGWFVPDACVIGEEGGVGRGFYLTMAGMTGGRMQTAGRASGVMRAALRAAIGHARDRRVFGAPLASWPLTQAKVARLAARALACRRLAFAVAAGTDDAARPVDASLAKLIACRSAELVTREAVQIHGGMGYAEESAVSRLFVDARVLSIFEGAEETLALKVIARALLDRAR
ncbi:acyl-CoA dehydrogenase [Sphingomonas sp. Leaf412]|uniref:acyl-CoA dehydrogenase family protein n=1 Tax=Sphingomonas sp. Leaf412 TaxID=1736370 RepID=UPI0006F9842A|nr:acyl-CoA dehydrogenase family protein [Sphingomonas sp. Leaf412]KQT35206.1 acyl-CoA dehydrogenase [Sphingomonas sp. Leaf412]